MARRRKKLQRATTKRCLPFIKGPEESLGDALPQEANEWHQAFQTSKETKQGD